MKLLAKLDLKVLKRLKNTKKYIFILILGLIFSLSVGHIVNGITLEPGSEDDPLVSKSYVDYAVQKLENNVNSKIDNIKTEIGDSVKDETKDKILETMAEKIVELNRTVISLSAQLKEQEKYLKFEVVEVEAGQTILLGESGEVILRSGKALAIAGENGDGLADITTDGSKNNLVTNDIVPANHLLLASRDDGRGLKAVTKIFVLVKGSYTIQTEQETEQQTEQQDEQQGEQKDEQETEKSQQDSGQTQLETEQVQ